MGAQVVAIPNPVRIIGDASSRRTAGVWDVPVVGDALLDMSVLPYNGGGSLIRLQGVLAITSDLRLNRGSREDTTIGNPSGTRP